MAKQGKRDVENRAIPRSRPVPINFRPEQVSLTRSKDTGRGPDPEQAQPGVGELKGVYIISVAARILAMHPQTLRKYERLGLVRPSRTIGMLRLYSEEDIEKLRLIRHLEENLGLNLAGVDFILNLLGHLLRMHQRVSSAKQSGRVINLIEQDMEQLFRNLNLPIPE